ncbi:MULTISPECIES: hypothetical protein [Acidovorax]|uniref:Uncharacterized protein n=1 Tax=Acidovorax facilis TaxID=12917 RepID=A0ABV8DB10_9BURK|nr:MULTISPECIES: hypothetical protein [Acidovorax]MBO1010787.1 hypothetical protein [Acidovorax sp. SD340]MCO4244788.1 hypothetical protein [Acidovorax facilis]
MNAIIKLLMGLGCVGMYLGWRYAPETSVFGIGMNTLTIYGSLGLVAAGFIAAMFYADESTVDTERTGAKATAPSAPREASEIGGLVVNPARSVVDVFYDDAGWRRF